MVYASLKVKHKAFFVLFYTLELLAFLFDVGTNFFGYWIVCWIADRNYEEFVADEHQIRVIGTFTGINIGVQWLSYSFAVWIFAVKYLQIAFSIETSINLQPTSRLTALGTSVVTFGVPLAIVTCFAIFFSYLNVLLWTVQGSTLTEADLIKYNRDTNILQNALYLAAILAPYATFFVLIFAQYRIWRVGAANKISIKRSSVLLHLGASAMQCITANVSAYYFTHNLYPKNQIRTLTATQVLFYWSSTVLLYIVFKIMQSSLKLDSLVVLNDSQVVDSAADMVESDNSLNSTNDVMQLLEHTPERRNFSMVLRHSLAAAVRPATTDSIDLYNMSLNSVEEFEGTPNECAVSKMRSSKDMSKQMPYLDVLCE